MKKINKQVKLNTNDQNKQLIFNFNSLYDNNFVLSIDVASAEVTSRSLDVFTGKSSWVEFLRSQIEKLVSDLYSLAHNREGVAKINDMESDDFLVFEASPLGQVVVSGQVGGSHRNHCLTFMFCTDQTILESLASDLEQILKYIDE